MSELVARMRESSISLESDSRLCVGRAIAKIEEEAINMLMVQLKAGGHRDAAPPPATDGKVGYREVWSRLGVGVGLWHWSTRTGPVAIFYPLLNPQLNVTDPPNCSESLKQAFPNRKSFEAPQTIGVVLFNTSELIEGALFLPASWIIVVVRAMPPATSPIINAV